MIRRMSKMMKKNRLFFVLCAIGLIISVSGCGRVREKKILYLGKARELGNLMIKHASASTSLVRMYETVWEYAAACEMDFQSAYRQMGLNSGETIRLMQQNKNMLDDLLHMLDGISDDFPEVKEALLDLHKSYLRFHRFIKKMPEVGRSEYLDRINAFIDELNQCKDMLDSLITENEALLR